jgi:hypothetical protein
MSLIGLRRRWEDNIEDGSRNFVERIGDGWKWLRIVSNGGLCY